MEAHRLNADSYEARIAAEISSVNPVYFSAVQALRDEIKLSKYNIKVNQDKALDELKLEKERRKDVLTLEKKRENDELLSDAKRGFDSETIDSIQQIRRELDDELERISEEMRKAVAEFRVFAEQSKLSKLMTDDKIADIRKAAEDEKDRFRIAAEDAIQNIREQAAAQPNKIGLSIREKAEKKNQITERYNQLDIVMKQDFDDREREIRSIFFRQGVELEKAEDRRMIETRLRFYPPRKITPPTEAVPDDFAGTVERIIDGDTIIVNGRRIRLLGIDAPEMNTDAGIKAKQFVTDLIFDKGVIVLSDKAQQFDIDGRVLAVVMRGDINVNAELLRNCHAGLFFVGDNIRVNRALFEEAFRECLAKTPAPTPAPPAPALPPPPAEVLQPPPPEKILITIISELEDRTRINGLKVLWDSIGRETEGTGIMEAFWNKGQATTLTIKAPAGFLILPDLVEAASINIDAATDYITTFILRKIVVAPPIVVPSIPLDVINFTGMTARVEFGKLDPLWPIGQAGFTTQAVIKPQRTFTLQELSVGDFESVGIRINFDSQFQNSQPLIIDFTLFKPDGQIIETPDTPTVNAGNWLWAKFAGVFAGPPREISQKGIYRLRAVTNINDVFNGTADYFFEVI